MFGSRKTGFFTTSGAGGGSSTNSQNLSETLGYGNQSSTNMLLLDDINAPTSQNSINSNLIQMLTDNDSTYLYYRPDLMFVQDASINASSLYANQLQFNYNDGEFTVQLRPAIDLNGALNFDTDANLFFPVPNDNGTTGGTGKLALNNSNLVEVISTISYDPITGFYTPVTNKNSTYIVENGDTGGVPVKKILLSDNITDNYIKVYFLIQYDIGNVIFQADIGFTIYGRSTFDTTDVNQTGMITIIRIDSNFFISNLV